MKLNDFYKKHHGKDIYILCSGKSCDFLSPDFFENKITMGVNNVYKKFHSNYLVFKEFVNNEVFEKTDEICAIFYSTYKCGDRRDSLNNITLNNFNLNETNKNRCVEFEHDQNCGYTTDSNYISSLFNQNAKIMTSCSTISSAIHLAFYMGAKNIILVGHDCCSIGGKQNFEGYHTNESLAVAWGNDVNQAKKEYIIWLSKLSQTTEIMQTILKNQFNVNLVSLYPFVSLAKAAHMVDNR